MTGRPAAFAIKAEVRDPDAARYAFAAQKTMYGGKAIAVGDAVYLFASENEGGPGLIARGIVTASAPVPKLAGVARQTPRVSVTIERRSTVRAPMGRTELRFFRDWDDGRPETELNFKLYRQATNKIVGLTTAAAAFLDAAF